METTEQEQIEALKRWWRQYGRIVLAAVVTAAVVGFGTWSWLEHRESQAQQASEQYRQLLTELGQGATAEAITRGRHLVGEYGGTPYAGLAALAMARAHVEQGDSEQASAQLRWAVDNARQPEVRELARLGLARLLRDAGEHREALALLDAAAPAEGFGGAFDEVRGDVYAAMGRVDEARAAYARALGTTALTGRGSVLQMKHDDLAGPSADDTGTAE